MTRGTTAKGSAVPALPTGEASTSSTTYLLGFLLLSRSCFCAVILGQSVPPQWALTTISPRHHYWTRGPTLDCTDTWLCSFGLGAGSSQRSKLRAR